MKWVKQLPSEIGWYWKRNLSSKYEKVPEIVYVRDYAGRLAIHNCDLDTWVLSKCEWAGPIPMPSEGEE